MRLLAAILALVLLAIAPAHAEKRVALVIGNAAYKNAAVLQNPKNDATDVSERLRRLGFETIIGLDLEEASMKDKSIDFARAARDADVALVYYSGHAMQFGGTNYLMPTDAVLRDEADLRRLIRVDEIVADLSKAKSLRILVLDACRVNPLAEELSRSMEATRGPPVDRGLARIVAPRGMIISYATQPGQTAADGRGRNSPYTTAFLKNIETSEEIGTVFRHMTADVYNETQGKQLPELSLSYIGDFYLQGRPKSDVAALTNSTPSPTPSSGSAQNFQVLTTKPEPEPQPPIINPPPGVLMLPSQVSVVAPPVAPPPPAVSSSPCGSAPITVSLSSRSPGPLSANEECALKPKDAFRECDKCPEMVVVPAGSFTMGSPTSEEGRDIDEGPQHRVKISRTFAVGRFSITFDEWDTCVADDGCEFKPSDQGWGRGQRPVIGVSWEDAKRYLRWLSRKTGKSYRLLSESEREYVTRAGTTTPFWWGTSISTNQANYNGNYPYGGGSIGEFRAKTMPVNSFRPNPWGLYGVHGNVYDWVEDCYHETYADAPSDGSAWIVGACNHRIVRGGGWHGAARSLRAADRDNYAASERSTTFSFRIARTLSP
jgi:formylglycine-generating enzyme required for sulfatase activity